MAELSDDSLSDDDALNRGEDDGPFGGLFHWASDPLSFFGGNKALGDDDRAWADDDGYKLSLCGGLGDASLQPLAAVTSLRTLR